VFQKLDLNQQLAEMDKTTTEEWVLVNGFVVSNTVIEDKSFARQFKNLRWLFSRSA
jgi:hypothetical protein